jgi:hypothetical protein
MEHNAQEACNRLVIQEIPHIADTLINKQDCRTHSKYFTGYVTSNFLLPIFSLIFIKE